MNKEFEIYEDGELVDNFTGTREEFDAYFDEHYSGGDFDWREF
jgi:hypothetical protein